MSLSFQAKAKSQEHQASTEQGPRSPHAVEATEVRDVRSSPTVGTRPAPSCPPSEATMEVHDPLMYSQVQDPNHGPPPYESVIMQECMKFPFADDV